MQTDLHRRGSLGLSRSEGPRHAVLYSLVKAENIAMRLAAACGLTVAPVRLECSLNKDVLLIERFDREHVGNGWRRNALLSALTLLELDELMARYASYADLADIIRQRFDNPRDTLRELFGRRVFNILCDNTDDHARNHAAFWDGARLSLTPPYDICPQSRTGTEANQAMHILGTRHESQLRLCLESAATFLLTPADAEALIRGQIAVIRQRFDAACDEAGLSQVDRARQFLNSHAFEGLSEEF